MIDLHTHLHPPKLFAAIRRWFAENSEWDLGANPTEPHAVAAALRDAGVERFVFFSYAHKPGMARDLNAWLAATSRELGGYGVPLATVHPDDADCVRDLRDALDAGCLGLKLHEDVQRVHADDPRFDGVYAELASRGAFLLVHAGAIPWEYVPGAGIDRVTRVLERFPELNVVVAHYGAPDSEAYFAAMDAHPRLHLDTTMVFARDSPVRGDIGAFDAGSIVRHADRVVYGTDFPNIPYEYDRERDGIAALGLPADVLEAVMHGNAARLLREAEGARA
ncbi:MAG: amidohydrolase [Candidatus Eremiobacteraeota bacterium]|nr:amidohydrolase [Candidatus Eremiobacteraeota bacterium]